MQEMRFSVGTRGGKGSAAFAAVALFVVLLALLAATQWSPAAGASVSGRSAPAIAGSAGQDPNDQAASASPNCILNASATPPDDHGRPADFSPSVAVPAAQAPTPVQVGDYARRMARMFGGTSVAPANAPLNASEMSFADFRAISGWPDNPTINSHRCVWVVTVHAQMAVKVPPGHGPMTVDVYSVAIDAASGTLIGLLAGSDLVH